MFRKIRKKKEETSKLQRFHIEDIGFHFKSKIDLYDLYRERYTSKSSYKNFLRTLKTDISSK